MIGDFRELKRDYLLAQRGVLDALFKTFEHEGRLLGGIPKFGTIDFEGEWIFKKHGLGVKFTNSNDGRIVDVHNYINDCDRIDAWRLVQYIDSLKISHIQMNEEKFPVDFSNVQKLLGVGLIGGARR